MGTWEIKQSDGKTTVTKKHPIMGFFTILLCLAVVVSEVEAHPWLSIPVGIMMVLLLGAAVGNFYDKRQEKS